MGQMVVPGTLVHHCLQAEVVKELRRVLQAIAETRLRQPFQADEPADAVPPVAEEAP